MADETCDDAILENVKFIKQLGGTEDLLFGFGTIAQIRNGQTITISKINADTIPYDNSDTVSTIIAKILAKYPL